MTTQRQQTKTAENPAPMSRDVVMPIILDEGQTLEGSVYLPMLREDLAQKHFGKSLQQIADSGGVTPAQAVAIKDHRWLPVDDKMGLSILNFCLRGGWSLEYPRGISGA